MIDQSGYKEDYDRLIRLLCSSMSKRPHRHSNFSGYTVILALVTGMLVGIVMGMNICVAGVHSDTSIYPKTEAPH
jgi:hypothetical protein